MYFAGDGAKRDEDGYFWLLGRVDDVMNVSGHRLSHDRDRERARLPPGGRRGGGRRQDRTRSTGEAIFAFVILRARHRGRRRRSARSCASTSRTKIGPIAKPKILMFTPDLPKTRSGKIMRRLLRDIAEGRPLGDTTTLADAASSRRSATNSGAAEE